MQWKRRVTPFLILLFSLLLAATAHAGGWVVITLDALPGHVRAGETINLGFMVRQHGKRPIDDVSPALTATHTETGETVRAEARPAGPTGHFEVDVTFPAAGEWTWQIAAPPFPQPTELEPIVVLPAAAGAGSSLAAVDIVRGLLRWGGVGLLALAALLALLSRRRPAALTPGLDAPGGSHG